MFILTINSLKLQTITKYANENYINVDNTVEF